MLSHHTARIVARILALSALAPALMGANAAPTATQPIPVQTLARAGSPVTVNLANYFQDPDVPGTAVRIAVRIGDEGAGNIDLALFDQQTPLTVANFLSYINSGRYANNILHRVHPGFVIQGGGFYFANATTVDVVTTFAPVQNEPGISNLRGTIAMAKVGSDPDSATSQWFINLSDDNVFLDQPPPVSNSFTVFGRVLGNGMNVVDQIAAVPIYNASSFIADWTQFPLTEPFLQREFVVETSASVIPALAFAATPENPSLVTTSVSGGNVQLTPSSTLRGETIVTVTVTDLEGAQVQATLNVSVLEAYSGWQEGFTFGNVTDALETADPDHDGYANLLEFAFGGDPLAAAPITGAPQAEHGGGVTFFHRAGVGLSYVIYESPDLQNWTRVWQTSDGFSSPYIAFNSAILGYNILTLRDPGGLTPRRFWKVEVTSTL